jgi:hypothetical protein
MARHESHCIFEEELLEEYMEESRRVCEKSLLSCYRKTEQGIIQIKEWHPPSFIDVLKEMQSSGTPSAPLSDTIDSMLCKLKNLDEADSVDVVPVVQKSAIEKGKLVERPIKNNIGVRVVIDPCENRPATNIVFQENEDLFRLSQAEFVCRKSSKEIGEISSNTCTPGGQQESFDSCASAREARPAIASNVAFASDKEKSKLPNHASKNLSSASAAEHAGLHDREVQGTSGIDIEERPAVVEGKIQKVSANASDMASDKVADSLHGPNVEMHTLQCPDSNSRSLNSTVHEAEHNNYSDISSSKINKVAMTELNNSDMSKIKENIANVDCLQKPPEDGTKIASSLVRCTEAEPKKLKINEDKGCGKHNKRKPKLTFEELLAKYQREADERSSARVKDFKPSKPRPRQKIFNVNRPQGKFHTLVPFQQHGPSMHRQWEYPFGMSYFYSPLYYYGLWMSPEPMHYRHLYHDWTAPTCIDRFNTKNRSPKRPLFNTTFIDRFNARNRSRKKEGGRKIKQVYRVKERANTSGVLSGFQKEELVNASKRVLVDTVRNSSVVLPVQQKVRPAVVFL